MTERPSRLRAWRIQRAQDRLDDTIHYRREWGFARTPSEMRKLDVKIDRLEAKVARLSGKGTSQTGETSP